MTTGKRGQAGPTPSMDACIRCGEPIASMGVLGSRVGGTSGGMKLFFGELAELGEQMVSLEAFGCSNYGHVELRHPAPTHD